MTNKWIKGDLDDMIFADCDWQPNRCDDYRTGKGQV